MTAHGQPSPAFGSYWRHRALKEQAAALPRPVIRSFNTDGLDEVEQLCWSLGRGSVRILDIGAGDQRLKRKFLSMGFAGRYETLDLSHEYDHDYHSLDEVVGLYDTIMLLEVIEHLPLNAFYPLIDQVEQRLSGEGCIVVSTPNPACIVPMWAGDMTHVQQYPLDDLLASFLARGFSCLAFRVVYTQERLSLLQRLRFQLRKLVVTQVLGLDYAEGLVVVAERGAAGRAAGY